jgi:hypothetical protein
MDNNRFTPKEIAANTEMLFSIPLYQRLFEWQDIQINQLLNDLKTSFRIKPNEPYYIGMLTAHKPKDKERYDLVDGQQRFTVLVLMGVALGWDKDFLRLQNNGELRLSFYARSSDKNYLESLISEKSIGEYKNAKMEKGIECIKSFFKESNDWISQNGEDFKKYIFEKLTFFISYLPETYAPHDLNKYFESMNATGRGLENHEILKVKLLKLLSNNKEKYTRIWNSVSDMDKPLIRQRYSQKEDIIQLNNRQNSALLAIDDIFKLYDFCNDGGNKNETISDSENPKIKDINERKDSPGKQIRTIGERAILSFPDFLLQILWMQHKPDEDSNDFFNIHKLQETFKKHLKDDEVEEFFKNLLRFRIIFDYYIIRINYSDQNTSTYNLYFKEEDESNLYKKLIQYQSLLYVSTTTNIWLTVALKYLERNPATIQIEDYFNKLVSFDNNRKKGEQSLSLRYGEIDRYWFWRLDYYLWESELDKLQSQEKSILDYTFKSNRSIEHLHPQTTSDQNKWHEEDLHYFGNLAMISPGFNSTQSNDDEEVKFARIKMQIAGKNMLESIKLLKMYRKAELNNNNWNQTLSKEHAKDMIEVLIDSFPDSEEYIEIRQKLYETTMI